MQLFITGIIKDRDLWSPCFFLASFFHLNISIFPMATCLHNDHFFYFLFKYLKNYFYTIVLVSALQQCKSAIILHIFSPSLASFPSPYPILPGHHRVPDWAPYTTQQLPTSCLSYIHIYNGILLSHKKEGIWISSSEVDEPRSCCTEWSNSGREKHICILYCIVY